MEREEKITVAIKEPGKAIKIKIINNELEELQKLVGGYIEIVRPLQSEIVAILNDMGKIEGLEPNFYAFNKKDVLVGTVVFSKGSHKGDLKSLSSEDVFQIEKYLLENEYV